MYWLNYRLVKVQLCCIIFWQLLDEWLYTISISNGIVLRITIRATKRVPLLRSCLLGSSCQYFKIQFIAFANYAFSIGDIIVLPVSKARMCKWFSSFMSCNMLLNLAFLPCHLQSCLRNTFLMLILGSLSLSCSLSFSSWSHVSQFLYTLYLLVHVFFSLEQICTSVGSMTVSMWIMLCIILSFSICE